MAKTTVQVVESEVTNPDGTTRPTKQYRLTIPRDVAEYHDLQQGDEIYWGRGSSKNKIELEILEGGDSGGDR